MKQLILSATICISIVSCTKENKTTTETLNPETETTTANPENLRENPIDENKISDGTYCYLHALNKDSIKVKLKLEGDKISGDLDRLPFEKDRAKGTFTGTKRADGKFDVDYKYMQEGTNQADKMVFKIDDDELEIENNPIYDADLKKVNCK